MPTILRLGRTRVMIYANDHRPAHVHVWDGRRQAVYNLNCPTGPIELRENYGFAWPAVNDMARSLRTHLRALCAEWKVIHGYY